MALKKCAEIVASLNEKSIKFCWKKAQLIDAPEIECPKEMENIEQDIQEEQILDYIEGKMAAIDIEDEDETLELVALDDEPILIENERPQKKKKQEKITSFFMKK